MSEIRFGGYRVTKTLGSGALSTIYEAIHEPLGRVVALKALKSEIAATSPFGEQLEREAMILADLAHPNVVLLLDAGHTPSGRPYLALERVDGPSLADVLGAPKGGSVRPRGTKRPLRVSSALAIACGICAALEHVHERGVVHRDVKPSNVLIARSGVVKLIDFGIAQRPRTMSMSDALGTEAITPAGQMAPEALKDAFGTPAYMSPEQVLGDFVDGRSDLFSLGVVLYELLSGSRPFDTHERGAPRRSAAQRIRREAPAPLRQRAPRVPRAVERIVMRLLEKSPSERYPSASVVRERLEAALRAETRDSPRSLVRAALDEAGFLPKGSGAPRESAVSVPGAGARAAMSVNRVLVGFAAITTVFVAAAAANETVGRDAREAQRAGAQPLELLPDGAGGLRVVATPWAHVRVDGQDVETTPFARPIPLAPGKHWVTLVHPDAPAPVEREIMISAGATVTLDVTMDLTTDEEAGADAP